MERQRVTYGMWGRSLIKVRKIDTSHTKYSIMALHKFLCPEETPHKEDMRKTFANWKVYSVSGPFSDRLCCRFRINNSILMTVYINIFELEKIVEKNKDNGKMTKKLEME